MVHRSRRSWQSGGRAGSGRDAAQGLVSIDGHRDVWKRSGQLEGGSHRLLDSADNQAGVTGLEGGRRLLERMETGAADVVDAGQVDDERTSRDDRPVEGRDQGAAG